MAARWIGWDNMFHCEINQFCTRILNHHFKTSIHYDNIKETDFTPWRERIDVLTGGFPCQPFSMAGKRKGAEDDRYLWPEMLRAIHEIKPRWIVGENVAGILSMVQPCNEITVACRESLFGENHGTEFLRQQYVIETICKDIEREGYEIQPLLIPACAVGAPHRRDRVWFIAHTDSERFGDGSGNREGRQLCRNEERYVAEDNFQRNGRFDRACTYGADGLASDTHGDRRWKRTDKQIPFTECKGETDYRDDGENGAIADTTSQQGERLGFEKSENSGASQGKSGRSNITDDNRECITPHRHSEQFHDGNYQGAERRNVPEIRLETSYITGYWKEFPSQPPVCVGDDGLSDRLDAITFSRWRMESVKAAGNAIVPQVAYEIFSVIDEIEKQLWTRKEQ